MPNEQTVRPTIRDSKKTNFVVNSASTPKRARREVEFGSPEWDVLAQKHRETIHKIRSHNVGVDPAIIEAEIDAALAEVRAEKRARMELAKTGTSTCALYSIRT